MKRDKKEIKNINSYLEQQRAEKLAEMGSYLRHLREEQSLSLEEVSAKTKVQARLLNAIEEGRLEPLPEPVYIKGFIQRYADALGLNGAEFASVFPTAQGFHLSKPALWRSWFTPQLKPIHLYLIYICLIVSAGVGLSNVVNPSTTPGNGIATEKTQTAKLQPAQPLPKAEPVKSDGVEVTSTASSNKNDPSNELRVDITLKADSWIRVRADGKTEFEGILPEGTQRTWTAKGELIVRAGNAGGVVVALNKGQAKELGAPGTVKEVAFKAD